MLDVDTFLTTLYVIVDDFCQSHRPQQRRPGPEASLGESEIITPGHLRSLEQVLQRAGFLPLRYRPPQRGLPYPS